MSLKLNKYNQKNDITALIGSHKSYSSKSKSTDPDWSPRLEYKSTTRVSQV